MGSFTITYQDHRHALKASNAIFEAAADADATYKAGRAMLAADGGTMASRRAYWETLEASAKPATSKAARAAYDASLAESAQHRADQAAMAELPALDGGSYGSDDGDQDDADES